ncbi:hypothetical protein CCY99_05110 [Helicobacter sp. 16-1353]|uniref:peroxide stress protein YaaA n=1 Tax=Helicobacter sp. 16-1353 TaxID=2004996 RepID=UPI000DCD99CC|nr:peroxide stress protein YaaA [Helicobacter sp. 16-1353]RAX54061.1 hypothetical protein CCY99_05110 [Helicobacter sp. 16-1353]
MKDLKILFSPSEDKNFIYKGSSNPKFGFLDSLLFGEDLRTNRMRILESYLEVLRKSPSSEVARIFGAKKLVGKIGIDTLNACSNLDSANTIESIFLYSGVAFKALDVASLDTTSVEFLRKNVVIFSNLFGAILGGDKIPYYKLKQGEKFANIDIVAIYKDFKTHLDSLLKSSEVLDLRAEFYTKAYKLTFPHTKIEFFKNGKENGKENSRKSTHFSKHYRGLTLRHIAQNRAFEVPFKLIDTKQSGFARILQYEV